jgi:hypothetical protein
LQDQRQAGELVPFLLGLRLERRVFVQDPGDAHGALRGEPGELRGVVALKGPLVLPQPGLTPLLLFVGFPLRRLALGCRRHLNRELLL